MLTSAHAIQKTIAWILAVSFLLLLLLSSAAMVSAIGHHCSGEHCDVCDTLHLLAALLRQLTWLWGLGVMLRILVKLAMPNRVERKTGLACFTPVQLRVRMNN